MKNFIFFAFAMMIVVSATAQKAEITFDETVIDIGKVGSDNAVRECSFVFKNTGDADLYIHQVIPSCRCSTEKYPTRGIKPGEKDTIFITYNGANKGPSRIRTSITIHSNAKQEMTKLYITGEKLAHPIKEVDIIEVE